MATNKHLSNAPVSVDLPRDTVSATVICLTLDTQENPAVPHHTIHNLYKLNVKWGTEEFILADVGHDVM